MLKYSLISFVLLTIISTENLKAQVLESWVRTFTSYGSANDVAKFVFTDSDENIYLAGTMGIHHVGGIVYGAVKFDNSGNLIWNTMLSGILQNFILNAATMDANNNMILTGRRAASQSEIFTVMLNNNGQILWSKTYNGISGFPNPASDFGYGVAVDSAGFIYVTGSSTGMGTMQDYILIKYDQQGDTVWTRRYHGTGLGNDQANAIAINGNYIYVTGYSYGANSLKDIVTLKYNTDGDEIWVKRFDHSGYDDSGEKITIDNNGDVIVAGTVGTYPKTIVIKYSQDGELLWNKIFNDPYINRPSDVKVDNSNNIIVALKTVSVSAMIVKLSENGSDQWSVTKPAVENLFHNWVSIDIDQSNNVYYAGNIGNQPVKTNLIKITPGGAIAWEKNYRNNNYNSYFTSVSISHSGNVYAAGYTRNATSQDDFLVIKYIQPENVFLFPFNLVSPKNDTVINLNNMSDSVLFKWTRSNVDSTFITYNIRIDRGSTQPMLYFPSNNDGHDSMLYMNKENFIEIANAYQNFTDTLVIVWRIVAYNTNDSLYSSTSRLVRITGIPTNITASGEIPLEYSLMQNFPNPFNPVTNIRFDIAKFANSVSLKVYSTLGKEVAVLVNQSLQPGAYEVSFNSGNLSSGIYFYELITDNFRSVKKMVLVR